MKPEGHEHGRIAMRLGSLLEQHVRAHRLGAVYAADTGFLIHRDPDTVRAADAAFVSQDRLDPLTQLPVYLPLAPDLVIEVVSPHDTFSEVEAKTNDWLSAGALLVLLVDPRARRVHVWRGSKTVVILSASDTLDASEVVAGWRLAIADVFS